jgi:hypothetical protein
MKNPMKTVFPPFKAKGAFVLLWAFLVLAGPASGAFPDELYDLCFRVEPLTGGKVLFVRHRNPTLDPVLRTFEAHIFDPKTGKISFLQKYAEKLYIEPAVSRDRTTVCYHSLIEGNDFLLTSNIEKGRSSRLRFDTGGYFLSIAIDYDNDTIAASIKRGANKQGLYVISNRKGYIKKVFEGGILSDIGFLENGNVCYVNTVNERKILAFAGEKKGRELTIEEVDYVRKTPRGDGIFYTKGPVLFLFRLYGTDSVTISRNFNLLGHPILISDDGSTAAFLEKGSIGIVNIPSGDIFYLISMDTEGTNAILTDFIFLLAKGKKVFELQHKKTGQALQELFTYDEDVTLLASSPDDRYIVFQGEQKSTLLFYDRKEQEIITKKFTQDVEKVLFAAVGSSCYVVTRTYYQEFRAPVRELYYYDFLNGIKTFVSTTTNTDIKLYLRNE